MLCYRKHAWCPFCGATRMLRIVEKWVVLIVVVEKRLPWAPFDGRSNCKGKYPPRLPKRKRRRRRSRRRRSRYNHPW